MVSIIIIRNTSIFVLIGDRGGHSSAHFECRQSKSKFNHNFSLDDKRGKSTATQSLCCVFLLKKYFLQKIHKARKPLHSHSNCKKPMKKMRTNSHLQQFSQDVRSFSFSLPHDSFTSTNKRLNKFLIGLQVSLPLRVAQPFLCALTHTWHFLRRKRKTTHDEGERSATKRNTDKHFQCLIWRGIECRLDAANELDFVFVYVLKFEPIAWKRHKKNSPIHKRKLLDYAADGRVYVSSFSDGITFDDLLRVCV